MKGMIILYATKLRISDIHPTPPYPATRLSEINGTGSHFLQGRPWGGDHSVPTTFWATGINSSIVTFPSKEMKS